MDFLSTMRTRCKRSFDCYVDTACLDHLGSPINLKTHWHEELVFRTAGELKEFQHITAMPIDDEARVEARRDKLRKWYDRAIGRKLADFGGQPPFKDLMDYGELFDKMENYDRVIFFGGCSLTILQQILERDNRPGLGDKHRRLGKKVEYYQQGVSNMLLNTGGFFVVFSLLLATDTVLPQGTFDSKLNILGNPLNFALNSGAAKFVFDKDQVGKLAKFVLIPTDTTKKFEFTVKGLTEFSPAVGLHSLGFFSRMDPWELMSPEESEDSPASTEDLVAWRSKRVDDPEYTDLKAKKGYKGVMADLVAYLISFTDAFDDFKTPQGDVRKVVKGVVIKQPIDGSEQMVLDINTDSPIQALMLEFPKGQEAVLVKDTLGLAEAAIGSS